MIPQTIDTWQAPTWKEELRDAVTDVAQLLRLLGLESSTLAARVVVDSGFPLRVPMSFVRRMEPGNPHDPLLLQVLPLAREEESHPGYGVDPLREQDYNPVPGVVHKYRGRVLLIATPVCAINCRYCFRRHFPYSDNTPGRREWQEAIDYIAGDSSISEVILSGGDPLAGNDRQLAWLAGQLEAIPHLRRLRIHTRLPVVIPQRVDQHLVDWLQRCRLDTVMVLHVNHPNEINGELRQAVGRLRDIGVTLLNQAVLLRGVNDNADVLVALSEALFGAGVLPYYLHLLDPVAGAHHFALETSSATGLYQEMTGRLPGYLLPRLVRDVPGQPAKMQIGTHF